MSYTTSEEQHERNYKLGKLGILTGALAVIVLILSIAVTCTIGSLASKQQLQHCVDRGNRPIDCRVMVYGSH